MAASISTSVSALYTITFLYIDPAICLWTVYMCYFTPAFMLNAYIPADYPGHLGNYHPAQSFLFQLIGTSYIFFGWVSAVLLRATDPRSGAKTTGERDLRLRVWSLVEAGLLVTDLSLLATQYFSLKAQGRLNVDGLRAEDVGNTVILIYFGAVRAAFITGAGVRRSAQSSKTQ